MAKAARAGVDTGESSSVYYPQEPWPYVNSSNTDAPHPLKGVLARRSPRGKPPS